MIDLEHFPTSPSAQRMMSRISPIYGKSYVGKWLFQVMGLEWDDAWLRFDELREQAFPETTTWAIEYWEERYAVIPKPGSTLEERRRNLIAKRGIRSPMNPARVEAIIGSMTGKAVECTENVAPYTFAVTIEGAEAGTVDLEEVYKRLYQIKPSHQTFILTSKAVEQQQTVFLGAGFTNTYSRRELPELVPEHSFTEEVFLGGAAYGRSSRRINTEADPKRDFKSTIFMAAGGRSPTSSQRAVQAEPTRSFTASVQLGGAYGPRASAQPAAAAEPNRSFTATIYPAVGDGSHRSSGNKIPEKKEE